jgi:hypothetical protein
MALTPSQRTQRARVAGYASWAATSDPSARGRPGQAALRSKFEREVDPDGVLPSAERARRAEAARKSHMHRLAFTSSRVRAARKGAAG